MPGTCITGIIGTPGATAAGTAVAVTAPADPCAWSSVLVFFFSGSSSTTKHIVSYCMT